MMVSSLFIIVSYGTFCVHSKISIISSVVLTTTEIKEPIKDNGNHNYQVTLPKFEFIGVELDKDKPYTLYDTSGGILSYSTKDIDTGEAVAEGFSNKEQQGFIKDNKKLLKESAEKYYSTMIKSLDHEAKVTIETQK